MQHSDAPCRAQHDLGAVSQMIGGMRAAAAPRLNPMQHSDGPCRGQHDLDAVSQRLSEGRGL